MKISKISTGKRLEKVKTFGELREGDTFYWVVPSDKSIEDITYKVLHKYNENASVLFGYSELNPDKMQGVKRDVSIDWQKENDQYKCGNISLPANSSFFVMNSIFWTTSLDLVYKLIEKYKLRNNFK